jgi:hypothetical protein
MQGARATLWPLAACSLPYDAPYALASATSHEAASVLESGHWVTPTEPLPTPLGPSPSRSAGMFSRVLAGIIPV